MEELIGLLAWGKDGWGDELATGAWLTIRLALATLPFGLFLGFLLALARRSDEPELVAAANVFVTVFRGLPELLTILIIYIGLDLLINEVVQLFSDERWELSKFVSGMVALGIVNASFSSEVILGAMKAIPAGQVEAARAMGLSRFYTWLFVVLPQLIRHALPGLGNLWLLLLKETALISVIALDDLMRQTNIVVGATKEPFFFYAVTCFIYLFFALASSVVLGGAERWANRGQER
ncbi:MAG: ABC transporter permease subunit [Pseudomonadota bacterium]